MKNNITSKIIPVTFVLFFTTILAITYNIQFIIDLFVFVCFGFGLAVTLGGFYSLVFFIAHFFTNKEIF
jgi:hypothetical protein